MAGIAQHTHGEGAVSATAARPEQDERDQRFLHEAPLLLGLCGVGFRVGHDQSLCLNVSICGQA
jgi:hypothetical protein